MQTLHKVRVSQHSDKRQWPPKQMQTSRRRETRNNNTHPETSLCDSDLQASRRRASQSNTTSSDAFEFSFSQPIMSASQRSGLVTNIASSACPSSEVMSRGASPNMSGNFVRASSLVQRNGRDLTYSFEPFGPSSAYQRREPAPL